MQRRNLERRRLLGIGLGGAGLGMAAAFGLGAEPALAGATRRLRVMTYNIHHAQGTDDVLDIERIARLIESQHVDVVGLQEVDRHWSARSEWLDQPAWLAGRLDMHYAYGANLDLDPPEEGKPRRQYGTAILSRWPIASWRNTYLPKFGTHEQRGLLEVVLRFRGTKVRVADTHLQHNDAAERVAQAQKVVELLGPDLVRTVLVGDLNATAETPEITTLTNVLADSWAKVGDGPGFTYSAEDPHARIDYVLASADLKPTRAEVLTSDGSDHLPYVADYLVTC